ncbi:MAG: tripartite tricarboxylate transporter TctB family protein [Kiloniellales bacterium]
MIRISRKRRDFLVFGLLLVLAIVLLRLSNEIPKGIAGDLPADAYPKALLVAAIVLVATHLVSVVLGKDEGSLTVNRQGLARVALVLAVPLSGYLILLHAGFLLGGAYLILGFGALLKERGWRLLLLAILAPPAVYGCLEYGFHVRLPSLLDAV